MVIEEVGDESKVELRVASDERGWGEEFAARGIEAIRGLEDLFGSLVEVGCLQGGAIADLRGELREQDSVILAIFDVAGEVLDAVA